MSFRSFIGWRESTDDFLFDTIPQVLQVYNDKVSSVAVFCLQLRMATELDYVRQVVLRSRSNYSLCCQCGESPSPLSRPLSLSPSLFLAQLGATRPEKLYITGFGVSVSFISRHTGLTPKHYQRRVNCASQLFSPPYITDRVVKNLCALYCLFQICVGKLKDDPNVSFSSRLL